MPRPPVLAIIQAGGKGGWMDVTRGGFRLLPPQQGVGGPDEQGFAQGNADEPYRVRDQIRAFDPELVSALSADHLYRFDFQDALATHRRRDAECTIVTTDVDGSVAVDHATVEYDDDGRVNGFAYKPKTPTTGAVATEIFAYKTEVLIHVLDELDHDWAADPAATGNGLGDFGDAPLPRFVERGQTLADPMPGYWRDVGEPHKYLAAHQDILREDQGIFGDASWPIISRQPQPVSARGAEVAQVVDSLLAPGVRVHGGVHRSVRGTGSGRGARAPLRPRAAATSECGRRSSLPPLNTNLQGG